MDIRLIASDMDGTLLDDEKNISERNLRALTRASEKGILVVPATGRMLDMLPEAVVSLPFVRYAIVSNGSLVKEIRTGETIFRAEIPCEEAVRICRQLKSYGTMFDGCIEGQAYMEKGYMDRLGEYLIGPRRFVDPWKALRKSVDDLPAFIQEKGRDVQKLQIMFKDMELRKRAMRELQENFPDIMVTSSVPHNLEINAGEANKGNALRELCSFLGIPMEQTLAFGDGSNDVTMLSMAGVGVAMGNACPEAKAAADYVTGVNKESGLASFLEKYVL